MGRLLRGAVAGLVLLAGAGWAAADGDVNLVLGRLTKEDVSYGGPDDQGWNARVCVDFGGKRWPVRPSVYASRWKVKDRFFGHGVTGTATEFGLGFVRLWKAGRARPLLGAGIAWITADVSGERGRESRGTSAGAYAHTGVFWGLPGGFNAGAEARFVTGTNVDAAGSHTDADYFQLGILLGWGWTADH